MEAYSEEQQSTIGRNKMDLIDMRWKLSDLLSRKAAIVAEISTLETALWNYGGSDLSWTLADAERDLANSERLLMASPTDSALEWQVRQDRRRVEEIKRKISEAERKKELNENKLSRLKSKLSSIEGDISSLQSDIRKKEQEQNDSGW